MEGRGQRRREKGGRDGEMPLSLDWVLKGNLLKVIFELSWDNGKEPVTFI